MADHPAPPMLRVAIDGTPLLGRATGVGVFTSSLISALDLRTDLQLNAFAVSWRNRRQLASVIPADIPTEQRAMPARPLTWLWGRSSLLAIERFVGSVDVVHGTNFSVPPARRAGRVVTVHDLTCLRYPEMCERNSLRYPRLIERALRRGAIVHTPSTFVADEVRSHFRAAREQVVAVHSGVPELPPPDGSSAAALLEPGKPYVLSIGTAEPRKDLPGLVRAFDALAATDSEIHLILAGPPGWGSDALNAAIAASPVKERIRLTGFVDDATLAALLYGARVLAYPSLYEGFGFPPLQAMAAGIPVVTTRAGALSETAGDAALVVAPGDVDALAEALDVAVHDEAQRSILITAGRVRVGDFTWDKTAAGLVEVYRRARDR